MGKTDGVARQLYEQLSPADQRIVLDWLRRGHSWSDAVVNSGVLSSREPRRTPGQHSAEIAQLNLERSLAEWELRRIGLGTRRETAEHEAAHAVVAKHLGLGVVRASIDPDSDSVGNCVYARGNAHQTAAVAMAGAMWIGIFRSLQFIGPPRGCAYDQRVILNAIGNDRPQHMRAWEACRQILKANQDVVLAVADNIERTGEVRFL